MTTIPTEAADRRILLRSYAGETYYRRPAVKHSPWRHAVGAYLFVAGTAGAAQVLAGIFKLTDDRTAGAVVRGGRWIGTLGAAAGAVLLIVDLRTKPRWYNMLRIFRKTSPMSIGTYLLGAFGITSGITLLPEIVGRGGRYGRLAEQAADVAQGPAALAGAGMATYTAALLSSTSTPEWAASPRELGVEFAASSVASAAAALSVADRVGGSGRNAAALDSIAAVATAANVLASGAAEARQRSLGVRNSQSRAKRTGRFADLAIAGALPLALYGLSRAVGGSRPLSVLAAAAILGGHYLGRQAKLESGNESAEQPRDYFRLARPEHMRALSSEPRVQAVE